MLHIFSLRNPLFCSVFNVTSFCTESRSFWRKIDKSKNGSWKTATNRFRHATQTIHRRSDKNTRKSYSCTVCLKLAFIFSRYLQKISLVGRSCMYSFPSSVCQCFVHCCIPHHRCIRKSYAQYVDLVFSSTTTCMNQWLNLWWMEDSRHFVSKCYLVHSVAQSYTCAFLLSGVPVVDTPETCLTLRASFPSSLLLQLDAMRALSPGHIMKVTPKRAWITLWKDQADAVHRVKTMCEESYTIGLRNFGSILT